MHDPTVKRKECGVLPKGETKRVDDSIVGGNPRKRPERGLQIEDKDSLPRTTPSDTS